MRVVYDTVARRARLQLPMMANGLVMRASTNGAPPSAQSPVLRDGALLHPTHLTRLQAFWGTSPVREERRVDVVRHGAVGARVHSIPTVDARYPGTGAYSLTDGLRGSTEHGDGLWQGWWTAGVTLDMTLPQPIEGATLDAQFLQNVRSWILFPGEVAVSWSADSTVWTPPTVLTHDVPTTREGALTRSFTAQSPRGMRARYVPRCGAWWHAAGRASWRWWSVVDLYR